MTNDSPHRTYTMKEVLEERYQTFLKEGRDPNSRQMLHIREKIAIIERKERMQELRENEPERYRFFMGGPNIHE